jgi:hypothetical protein
MRTTKKYNKSNIFNKIATSANNGSKYKKTRKIKRGGGIFDFFKSNKTNNIQSNIPVASLASTTIQRTKIVTGILMLSTIASDALSDPTVLKVITGIASTSIALASGGAVLVGIAVITSAWFVIKAKKQAYKGLILVMDELYLVLQKLSDIVNVSMHIAETYGFPIDTRSVSTAMGTIMNKFDELLDATTNTDYAEIKRNLSDYKKLKKTFDNQANSVINAVNNAQDGDDLNDPQKITLTIWTKIKKSNIVTSAKQVIMFSASEFVKELNESVAYLALHVAGLSASFSITYMTVVVQLLVSGKMADLKTLQEKVLNDNNFHSMLEAAFVIPLMQALKSHNICVEKDTKNTYVCDKNFVDAAENARLYMKSKLNNTESVGNVFYTKMKNLSKVVESSTKISSGHEATIFATTVNEAFKMDKSPVSVTTSSEATTLSPAASEATTLLQAAAPAASEATTLSPATSEAPAASEATTLLQAAAPEATAAPEKTTLSPAAAPAVPEAVPAVPAVPEAVPAVPALPEAEATMLAADRKATMLAADRKATMLAADRKATMLSARKATMLEPTMVPAPKRAISITPTAAG